jgi:hypothetical protein
MSDAIRDKTRAVSSMGSPRESWESGGARNIEWPPNWAIPVSNDTRVRVDDLSKTRTAVWFLNIDDDIPDCNPDFNSIARAIIDRSSSGVKSIKLKKCRMATAFIVLSEVKLKKRRQLGRFLDE